MLKLTIYTAASGHYIDYLPLWGYCAKKAYSKSEVSYDTFLDPIVPHYAACFRLLTEIHDTEYVYINDADMMILPEDQTLFDFHTKQMEEDDLCYSNSPRTKEPEGQHRLTGLHFCNQEWYSKTREARVKYLHMLDVGEIGNHKFDDEKMLMQVAKKSGLEIPQPRPLLQRHHGIHIGTIRAYNYKRHTRNTRDQQLRMRISQKQAHQWVSYYDDPEFEGIVKHVSKRNRVIKDELEKLYGFCMRHKKDG